jgi:hypothetical protein
MEINCVAQVKVRKGLSGEESFLKPVFVGLDDLPNELSEPEIKDLIAREVDSQMMRSEDFRLYGKNWEVVDIEHC